MLNFKPWLKNNSFSLNFKLIFENLIIFKKKKYNFKELTAQVNNENAVDTENKSSTSTLTTTATSEIAVIFGQNLTERVVNPLPAPSSESSKEISSDTVSSTENKQNGGAKKITSGADEIEKNNLADSSSKSKPIGLWSNENSELAEKNEQDDLNTILKVTCKLYVLESDKANWAERGYGIFKLIDTPDETNCKISKKNFF
jgi:hypothetical protein